MALVSILMVSYAILIIVLIAHVERVKRDRSRRYLPGPKGLPIIGSVADLPAKCSWMKFHEWGEQYGPIYQCNLAGTNHVWICRDKIAHDLLSKRSAIYSDRPFIPALEQDNRTSGQYLPLMSRNELWLRQRKFAKQIMDTSLKASFYNYPEIESVRLLFELMADPSRYNHALESFIARVTCRLAWGTSAPSEELKQRARELLIGVSPTGALGNKLPFIMSLPEKLAPAKAWETRRSRTERKFFRSMQQEVASKLSSGGKPSVPNSRPKQSWMRMFLENKKAWGFADDTEGAFAVGMHGSAGALTIAAPMQSFCLALTHYPQYQPILHQEIDRVLGDRMPTFDDMPNMPVLRAFIRETLRWRPPVPTGIPHESTQDDIYDGYFIPKGSVMHPLEWSISRDPEQFPDPDAWNPMRWIDSNFPTYQEPLTKYPTITGYSQFGYGRRTCQGEGVTEADLFVGIGSIAWLFSINPYDEAIKTEPDLPPAIVPESRRSSSISSDRSTIERERKEAMERLTYFSNESTISIPGDFPCVPTDIPTPPKTPEIIERRQSGLRPLRLVERMEERRRSRASLSLSSPMSTPPQSPSSVASLTFSELSAPSISPPPTPKSEAPPSSTNLKRKASYEDDPTMNFSTLLIAKPMPFRFGMQIRDEARAERVVKEWTRLKMKGEFEDARVYWQGGTSGTKEYGWGETIS